MIIKTDKEGKEVILQLCDIALKQTGMSNVDAIYGIYKRIQPIEEIVEDKKKAKK